MKRHRLLVALGLGAASLLSLIWLSGRQADIVLSRWADISSIAQGYLILVSFVFLGYEIRQSVELTKAANSQALAEQAGNFNSLLIQDPDVAKIWYSYGKSLDESHFVAIAGRERYRELLVQWLILHENIFYQKKKRLLDPLIYNGWLADLKVTLRKHDVSVLSKDLQELFPGEFGKHLKDLKKSHSEEQVGGT